MISIIRSIITKFNSPLKKVARFSATGRVGETFTDREVMQNFGFASALPKGAEALLIKSGQNVYLIASDDRRYRVALNDGEVALYNTDGDSITLKNGHDIEINAGATGKVVVTAGNVYLGAELLATAGGGVVTVNCPCITGGIHPLGSQTVRAAL